MLDDRLMTAAPEAASGPPERQGPGQRAPGQQAPARATLCPPRGQGEGPTAASALEPRYTRVLSTKKRLISIHALRPSPLDPEADAEEAAASDRWAVAEASGRLADRAFRAAVLIRLHYPTLATMRHRQPLMLACRRLPEAARRRLLVELAGLPEALPQPRVRELVSYLRPFTLGTFVAVERAAFGGCAPVGPRPREHDGLDDRLANCGIAGLSLDLAHDGGAGSVPALLARATPLGVRTLCHVGGERRLCRAAIVAGIDYLEGEALGPNPASTLEVDESVRPG